jgi:hypothetical protein
MLFQVVDHYNEDQDEDPVELHDCLICLETKAHENKYPIDLNVQLEYVKKCCCGGWFHSDCLLKWHSLTQSCPICRTHMRHTSLAKSVCSFYVANLGRSYIAFSLRMCYMCIFMLLLRFTYNFYQNIFTMYQDQSRYVADSTSKYTYQSINRENCHNYATC